MRGVLADGHVVTGVVTRIAALNAAVAIAYVMAAQTGFAFAFATEQVTAVWPPTGLALAAIVLGGQRLWAGVFMGALAANLLADVSVAAVGIAVGNTAEAVAGGWLLAHVAGFRPDLRRMRDVLAVMAVAFTTPFISATVGVASLVSAGAVATADFPSVWRIWWAGDVGGDLLIAPLLLVGATIVREGLWLDLIRAAGAAAGVGVLGWVIFGVDAPVGYLMSPVVFGIALWLRQPGMALSGVTLAGVVIFQTAQGNGQFAHADPDIAMLRAQMYAAVVAVTGLLIAAIRTERERAEDAERQLHVANRELAAASAAKSRFLANVSHELRTPIHVIVGFAATLLSERPGTLNQSQRDQLEAIQRSGEHLNGLIANLLDMARNSIAQQPLVVESVACAQLLDDVAHEMSGLALERGIDLRVEASEEHVVLTDRRALRQILLNLTGNAIKFTDVGEVVLASGPGPRGVRLSVRDTGCGIAPDDHERLFEAFEQLGTSVEGLGLGLHISRSLAERLNAQLSVTSTVGRGSTFSVDLAKHALEEHDSRGALVRTLAPLEK